MVTAKKLLFAVPFLIFFYLMFYLSLPYLKSTDYLFSLDLGALKQLIFLCLAIFLTGFFYVIFASLASDWAIILPVSLLCALLLILLPVPNILIFIFLSFGLLLLIYWLLSSKLKTYLNFQPNLILAPSVSSTAKFFVLLISLVYFLSINSLISQNGFNLPDSLINLATSFAPQTQGTPSDVNPSSLPKLTSTQIDLLKAHPELLKQYGLDPSLLDQIQNQQNQQNSPNQVVGGLLKTQFQSMIKPYTNYIPAVLAALFFVTLYSFVGIILIFSGPLLSLAFWILEETGFTKFQVEQREVRKLIV